MRHLILAASALALIACGNTETDASMEKAADIAHDMAQMNKGIEISSAYVLPPFPGRDVAAGFFQITNHGANDRLISVSSPVSQNVEIHNHIEENGVMKMRKIDGVDLPKGGTVSFEPGSFHIMMFGANMDENTEDVALTLTYEKADAVTLIVPVGDPDDRSEKEMDHSSHGPGDE